MNAQQHKRLIQAYKFNLLNLVMACWYNIKTIPSQYKRMHDDAAEQGKLMSLLVFPIFLLISAYLLVGVTFTFVARLTIVPIVMLFARFTNWFVDEVAKDTPQFGFIELTTFHIWGIIKLRIVKTEDETLFFANEDAYQEFLSYGNHD